MYEYFTLDSAQAYYDKLGIIVECDGDTQSVYGKIESKDEE